MGHYDKFREEQIAETRKKLSEFRVLFIDEMSEIKAEIAALKKIFEEWKHADKH